MIIGRTANLRTEMLDFRGFDSNIILVVRGGILMSIGSSLEILSQRILVWRLGVHAVLVDVEVQPDVLRPRHRLSLASSYKHTHKHNNDDTRMIIMMMIILMMPID